MAQKTQNQLIAGSIFILIGLVFLIDNLNILNNIDRGLEHIFLRWYSIMLYVGLALLVYKRGRGPGIPLTIIGSLFTLEAIGDVVHYDFWDTFADVLSNFWPLVFVFIGIAILMRSKLFPHKSATVVEEGEEPGKSDESHLDELTIFGGVEKKLKSNDFRGGRVTSFFGGSTIDLTEARMAHEDVRIDVFSMFGGNTFVIPADWSVDIKVTAIFGGFSDNRPKHQDVIPDPRKHITLTGLVLFGGGEVKS